MKSQSGERLVERKVIIMRHEPTIENRLGVIQGQSIGGKLIENELSTEKLAWLQRNVKKPAIILSSSLVRSVKSAHLLSEKLGIEVRPMELLRQRGWGDAEGKNSKDLGASFVKNAFLADDKVLPEGAESLADVRKRASNVWDHIKEINAKTVIVVTHDEFSNYLINHILDEGLFKRALAFNEAHVIEMGEEEIIDKILHYTITAPPLEHNVLVRSDSSNFTSNEMGVRILTNRGIRVITESEDYVPELIEGIIIGDKPFLEQDLMVYPSLRVIARFGKGVDNIRIKPRDGLQVTNTPDCNEEAVAEFTVGAVLNLVRRVPILSNAIKNEGEWPLVQVAEWSQTWVGIIGIGPIGERVAMVLKNLGLKVIVWTPNPGRHRSFLENSDLALVGSVYELCSLSDVVTLHIRSSTSTKGIIGVTELEAMSAKKGYVANTARSDLLDYKALNLALKKGWISGAVLDVFPEEPPKSKWLKDLIMDPRIVVTPHTAGATNQAIEKAIALCAYNISWSLQGRWELTTSVPWEDLE